MAQQGRRSLSRAEYMSMGASKGLIFAGTTTPSSVYTRTVWICNLCGKRQEKTYRAVKVAGYGCSCQRALRVPDYHRLALNLGIRWVGARQPTNSKTPTMWLGANGDRVECSYHDLAWGNASKKLLEQLGIN